MANEQNLIPQNMRTPEERKEIAKKGAEATNRIRRERKTFKEAIQIALNTPMSKEHKEALENGCLGALLKEMDHNLQTALIGSMLNEVLENGNSKVFEFLVALAGEKPVDVVKQEVEVKESKLDKLSKQLFGDDN